MNPEPQIYQSLQHADVMQASRVFVFFVTIHDALPRRKFPLYKERTTFILIETRVQGDMLEWA